jgi:hypothetical protein
MPISATQIGKRCLLRPLLLVAACFRNRRAKISVPFQVRSYTCDQVSVFDKMVAEIGKSTSSSRDASQPKQLPGVSPSHCLLGPNRSRLQKLRVTFEQKNRGLLYLLSMQFN